MPLKTWVYGHKRWRAGMFFGLAAAYSLFLAYGTHVLDAPERPLHLLGVHHHQQATYTAHGTGMMHVHVYRAESLIGVVRTHEAEVVAAEFVVHETLGLQLETRDAAGRSARTDVSSLARLPVIEPEHMTGVRDTVWAWAGRPVVAAGRDAIRWASARLMPQAPDLQPGPYQDACDGCPEMRIIPSGSFVMGSPETEAGRFEDEGPQRTVEIAAFALGRTEVTFDEWAACVADSGCTSTPEPDDRGWGSGQRPVIYVNWEDAKEYVAWLNTKVPGAPYRLPTEAEWEYAARATTTTRFHWGDDSNNTEQCAHANGADATARDADASIVGDPASCSDGYANTAPVGSFAANGWGLHDMSGNVYEWVEDCWHETYENAPLDGGAWMEANGGDCSRAVLRGGAWSFGPEVLRSAFRVRYGRGFRFDDIGFRLARRLP